MPQDSNRGGSHRNGGRPQVLPTSDRGEKISKPNNMRSSLTNTPDLVVYGLSLTLIVIGVIFLIIGSIYAIQCPIEPMVPIWLLLMGVLIGIAGGWHGMVARRIKKDPFTKVKPIEKTVSYILLIIFIIWFIAGNVFVYKAWGDKPDFGHDWFSNSCNKTAFVLSVCAIIAMDSIVGLSLIVFCFWGLSQVIVRE